MQERHLHNRSLTKSQLREPKPTNRIHRDTRCPLLPTQSQTDDDENDKRAQVETSPCRSIHFLSTSRKVLHTLQIDHPLVCVLTRNTTSFCCGSLYHTHPKHIHHLLCTTVGLIEPFVQETSRRRCNFLTNLFHFQNLNHHHATPEFFTTGSFCD